MEYLLVILIGIGVIWAVYYFTNKAEKNPKEEAQKNNPDLIVNLPGVEKTKKTENKQTQESLDTLYAKSHGMWVCHRCETINDGMAQYCSACGAKK